jgi:hypothetical protein
MNDKRTLLGVIGVDSGQMMLCDPCYVSSWTDSEYDSDKQDGMRENERFDFSYNGACAATYHEEFKGGILQNNIGANLAAVCSAGFGDGVYEVWVTVGDYGEWGKRVSKMEIIFLEEDE